MHTNLHMLRYTCVQVLLHVYTSICTYIQVYTNAGTERCDFELNQVKFPALDLYLYSTNCHVNYATITDVHASRYESEIKAPLTKTPFGALLP